GRQAIGGFTGEGMGALGRMDRRRRRRRLGARRPPGSSRAALSQLLGAESETGCRHQTVEPVLRSRPLRYGFAAIVALTAMWAVSCLTSAPSAGNRSAISDS